MRPFVRLFESAMDGYAHIIYWPLATFLNTLDAIDTYYADRINDKDQS